LLGLQKKSRVYHRWKKGRATQEEYRGLVRSCRKGKAQLELRLATCYSLAMAGNKRATWLLCHPSPHWGGEENGKKQAKTRGSG